VIEARVRPFVDDLFFVQHFEGFSAQRPRAESSLGVGGIFGADAISVSNYHVVGQPTDIRVALIDQPEYDAAVLLADEKRNPTIFQLENAADLVALDLPSSDTVEVGELVLAVGNRFGVGQTASSGIVSGLARSGVVVGNARSHLVQTDARINLGNSDGALVDNAGRLIGIKTSILCRSGGRNSIGFANPATFVGQFVLQARAGATDSTSASAALAWRLSLGIQRGQRRLTLRVWI